MAKLLANLFIKKTNRDILSIVIDYFHIVCNNDSDKLWASSNREAGGLIECDLEHCSELG